MPHEETVAEHEIWLQLEHTPAPQGCPFLAPPLALGPVPTPLRFGVLAVTSMISQLGPPTHHPEAGPPLEAVTHLA